MAVSLLNRQIDHRMIGSKLALEEQFLILGAASKLISQPLNDGDGVDKGTL